MARLFLDESLPPQLAEPLRNQGHDVRHVRELGLAGASDEAIYAKAEELDAVLVTLDLDFSDVRRFSGPTPIIVLRLRTLAKTESVIEFATTRIVRYRAQIEELRNAIMILEPRRSRIRRKY